MTKKLCLKMILALAMAVLFAEPAAADKVAEILAKVDSNLTNVDDQKYRGEIKVIRENKIIKTLIFDVKLKGLKMKLVKFISPGDVRGMTVLTTEDDHTYVYLPSYKRVRRVASHVRNQGFMGTDLSAEDMTSASLSVGWKATIQSEDKDNWILLLKPMPGNETVFSKLRVTVLKKYTGVSKLEFFNAGGKLVKTQVRKEWKSYGPITLPTFFTVTDHKTGSKTEMRFSDCEVNTGISDRAFTKRAIMRAD